MTRSIPAARLLFVFALLVCGAAGVARAQFQSVVLIEEFNSATCIPCVQATPVLNAVVADHADRVTSIRYHMNFPHPNDPFYLADRADNDARYTFYGGQAGLPYARVGGEFPVLPTDESQVRGRVDQVLATDAPIGIEVTQEPSEDSIKVTVVVTAGPSGLQQGYKLRVAAVENAIHRDLSDLPNDNGEKDFYDVFRAFLTTSDGVDITLNPNEQKTFSYSYALGADWQAQEMYAVAWVQDAFDPNPILQAGFSPTLPSRVQQTHAVAGCTVASARPNPADDVATIPFTLSGAAPVVVTLHNAVGAEVRSIDAGAVTAGSHTVRLDVSDLPCGVYTWVLRAGTSVGTGQVVVLR